jgi:hypothetical protein
VRGRIQRGEKVCGAKANVGRVRERGGRSAVSGAGGEGGVRVVDGKSAGWMIADAGMRYRPRGADLELVKMLTDFNITL